MAEESFLARNPEALLAEQLEGRKRADRVERVLWPVLHRVVHPGEVNLLVLDMGKGECLVALRHRRNLVQVRLWQELVDEVLAGRDVDVERLLERVITGALGLSPRRPVLQHAG